MIKHFCILFLFFFFETLHIIRDQLCLCYSNRKMLELQNAYLQQAGRTVQLDISYVCVILIGECWSYRMPISNRRGGLYCTHFQVSMQQTSFKYINPLTTTNRKKSDLSPCSQSAETLMFYKHACLGSKRRFFVQGIRLGIFRKSKRERKTKHLLRFESNMFFC